MKSLSETWFAEGRIDFELKKYTLLAYLQEVDKYFNENKLYPQLADVIFHYHNIVAFRENDVLRVGRGSRSDLFEDHVSGQWSVFSGRWSVVSVQWSVVSGRWSVVSVPQSK